MTCPCGLGASLETCCGPFIDGKKLPRTAEELMRSRYTAFALHKIDYIMDTHHPDTVAQVDRKNTEQWSQQAEWLGFELLGIENGQAQDSEGMVEFVARYKIKSTTLEHRERAQFKKKGKRWLFVDGQEVAGPPVRRSEPRVGRNDPCPCGSGKKYKKCCGKAA